jgi:uncharacterized protein (TIGR00369 family)
MAEKQAPKALHMETLRRFWEEMPFNRFLGMKIESFDEKKLCLQFSMKDAFVGNSLKGDRLHGGVIAAIIDTTGGMLASISEMKRQRANATGKQNRIFGKGGTIDLRIDYLRPGFGSAFWSTGSILKHGTNVIVTKMEMTNEQESIIAVGMGTYFVE